MTDTTKKVVPFLFNGSEVRTVKINGEPFFVMMDVCRALNIINHNDALKALDEDEVRGSAVTTPGGTQTFKVINESGLYHLIFRSRKPEAKQFRRWVTSEVLPMLRKEGAYVLRNPLTDAHGQGFLFPVENTDLLRAQRLMVDVALQVKPGSKVAQFLRMVKPLLFNQ